MNIWRLTWWPYNMRELENVIKRLTLSALLFHHSNLVTRPAGRSGLLGCGTGRPARVPAVLESLARTPGDERGLAGVRH